MAVIACAPSEATSDLAREPIGPPAFVGPPSSAQGAKKSTTTAIQVPNAMPPAYRRAWRPEWSRYVAHAIERHSPELVRTSKVPLAEIKKFCPGFARATVGERKAFWAVMFAAISRFESTFDPAARSVEPFADPETHRPEVSEGLLQLSYSDRLNHPDCQQDRDAGNLTDPEINLGCGVAIMRQQIAHRQTLFPDHFYYWSVLTKPKMVRRVKRWLKAALAHEAYCGA